MPVASQARPPSQPVTDSLQAKYQASPQRTLLLEQLRAAPYRFDFYFALRALECAYPELDRIGTAPRPARDAVRFGQEPSMAFAPSTLASLTLDPEAVAPRLNVLFFGLFGPNGPLPLHLTEYARERIRNYEDDGMARFADVFHHRLISLFYRSWSDAQPFTQFDRPREDRFSRRIGSFIGVGTPATRDGDALADLTKLHFSGILSSHRRNAEGLEQLLKSVLSVPVNIEEFVGQWLEIEERDRLRLDASACDKRLGQGSTLGDKVWECQSKIRVVCGPLRHDQFVDFLPGGRTLKVLAALMRTYVGLELDWDLQLVLRGDQIPQSKLGVNMSLGWASWLGNNGYGENFTDLIIAPNAECIG